MKTNKTQYAKPRPAAEPLLHYKFSSLIKKKNLFGRGAHPAPDDHQLVVHVIGTQAQCSAYEEKFFDQCQKYCSGLNHREGKRKGKKTGTEPRELYTCTAFVSQVVYESVNYPMVIEQPNVLYGE